MLDGFVVGHWRYGFVGLMLVLGFTSKKNPSAPTKPPTKLRGQLYFVPAFLAIIHFSILWPALHRNDSAAELLFFQTGMFLVVFLGSWVAYRLVKVLYSPLLIPIGHPDFLRMTVGALLMIFGLTFVAGFYAGEIDETVTLSVGIIALVVGALILIYYFYLYLWSGDQTRRARIWATIILILLLGIQAIYDFLLAVEAIEPFHGAILLTVMIVAYGIAYLIERRILASGPFGGKHGRNLYFWMAMGSIDFLTTLVTYIVDISTGTDFWAVFYSQIGVTVVWVVLLWFVQWTGFHTAVYKKMMSKRKRNAS